MKQRWFERFQHILQSLKIQATAIDEANESRQIKRAIWQEQLFSHNLFQTESYHYVAFVEETEKKLYSLKKLISLNKSEQAESLLETINQQINALVNAINANESLFHESQYQQASKKRAFYKRQQQATQKTISPNQNLYQKLAEHHNYERRLKQMLSDAEQERVNASTKNATTSSQKVLALHQRLGRCRQAISAIELEIERHEKRQ